MTEKITAGYATEYEAKVTENHGKHARLLMGRNGGLYDVAVAGQPKITVAVENHDYGMWMAVAITGDKQVVAEADAKDKAVRKAIANLLHDLMTPRARLLDELAGAKQAAADPVLNPDVRKMALVEAERLTNELAVYDEQADDERRAARKE